MGPTNTNGDATGLKKWVDLANTVLDRPALILLALLVYWAAGDAGFIKSKMGEAVTIATAHEAAAAAERKATMEDRAAVIKALQGVEREMRRRARIDQALCLAQSRGDRDLRSACLEAH